jgi:hypothetical protein
MVRNTGTKKVTAKRDVIQDNQPNYTITQTIQLPGFIQPPSASSSRRRGEFDASTNKGLFTFWTLTQSSYPKTLTQLGTVSY